MVLKSKRKIISSRLSSSAWEENHAFLIRNKIIDMYNVKTVVKEQLVTQIVQYNGSNNNKLVKM